LTGAEGCRLDTRYAGRHGSQTKFNEGKGVVFLGANAYSGRGADANARMSMLACLAHELAHHERHMLKYGRPTGEPESLLDEAETSLRASFMPPLSEADRLDLVEDARDRLNRFLAIQFSKRRGI
jgi:hypothetical protein